MNPLLSALSQTKSSGGASNDGQGDIDTKLKALKDKKIKIKIKGVNSSREMSLSQISGDNSLLDDNDPDVADLKQSLMIGDPTVSVMQSTNTGGNSPHRDKKKNNPLFWSSATGVEKKEIDTGVFDAFDFSKPKPVTSEEERMRARADMQKEISKLLNKDTSASTDPNAAGGGRRDRKDNPLFYSTMPAAKKIEPAIPRDNSIFEEFLIPRQVSKIIEEEAFNLQVMEAHLDAQKQRVHYDLDQMMAEIAEAVNIQKLQTEARLNDYSNCYRSNYKILREKITQFREKAKIVYNTSQDLLGNTQQTFNPVLQAVMFYKLGQEFNEMNQIVNVLRKFKEETCNLQANANTISREVSKKLLLYLSDEMSKQTQHKPLYMPSETMQQTFQETKANVVKYVKEQFSTFSQDCLLIQPPENLGNTYAFPRIEASISDDHISIVGDSERLINMKLTLEKYSLMGTEDSLMCLHAVGVEHVAIGTSDGFIKLWNYCSDSLTSSFQAHSGAVNTITTMKAQLNDINELVLLTGGSAMDPVIRVWHIQAQKPVRLLKGHKDAITSLLPLRDGATLLSSSRENEIYVWNLITGKLFNKIAHHVGPVNNLLLLKDNLRFVSASSDCSFCLWKINYAYSNDYHRRMFYSCDLEKKFVDTCEIYTLNAATTDPYIVITGGADNKIKIWNIENDACIQEIVAHSQGVAELMYFENPFKMDIKDNFVILSLGFEEDGIVLSKSSFETGVMVAQSESIKHFRGTIVQHRMQIVRQKNSDNIKVLMIGQAPGRGLLVWQFQ